MDDNELQFLRTKLKNGEYDGADIMHAWLAIDELREFRARGERAVLVGLLIECDKVLSTLEGESDEEAGLLAGLRDAILRATMPHRPDEDGLLAVRAGYGPNAAKKLPP